MHRTKIPSIQVIMFRRFVQAIKKQERASYQMGCYEKNSQKYMEWREVWLHCGGIVQGILDIADDMEEHYRDMHNRFLNAGYFIAQRERRKHQK